MTTDTAAFIYRFLLQLLFPAIAAGAARIALRDGSARYLAQRFGRSLHAPPHARPRDDAQRPLWLHCASVGETKTALVLVRAWLKRHPGDTFVLTTNTVTAARMLASHAPADAAGRIEHYYLPLDYPSFCRRFLDATRPRCALIMETEIWLHLFSECRRKDIPLLIINARVSQRTLDAARRFAPYYRHSLAAVRKVFARTDEDAAAFTALGVEQSRIEVVGNLKRADDVAATTMPDLIGGRYILAASTHEDEEIQVAEAWRRALKQCGESRADVLIIAPRHPRRARVIARQLTKRGFNVQRRSREPALRSHTSGNTSVYIADTLGELPALIRHAALVFTGGSLVPVGGHNVLEPAQLGTPQVVGPHTQHFHEEVSALKNAGGLLEINDENALEKVFIDALKEAPTHAAAAQKALDLMQTGGDIAADYATRIEKCVG